MNFNSIKNRTNHYPEQKLIDEIPQFSLHLPTTSKTMELDKIVHGNMITFNIPIQQTLNCDTNGKNILLRNPSVNIPDSNIDFIELVSDGQRYEKINGCIIPSLRKLYNLNDSILPFHVLSNWCPFLKWHPIRIIIYCKEIEGMESSRLTIEYRETESSTEYKTLFYKIVEYDICCPQFCSLVNGLLIVSKESIQDFHLHLKGIGRFNESETFHFTSDLIEKIDENVYYINFKTRINFSDIDWIRLFGIDRATSIYTISSDILYIKSNMGDIFNI